VIELLGSDMVDMPRFHDYVELGFRITDNYETDEDLRSRVEITSNLGNRNDTLWAELSGWKYVRYRVTDQSGNVSKMVERSVLVLVTSLNEIENSTTLIVYPNPSSGKFTISTKEPIIGKTEVTMYNVLGAKVYSQSINMNGKTADIAAEELPSGIYLLQLTNNGKQYTQRVTIK
jgi:hypothetical protein